MDAVGIDSFPQQGIVCVAWSLINLIELSFVYKHPEIGYMAILKLWALSTNAEASVPELRDQDSYLEGSNSLFQDSRNRGNKVPQYVNMGHIYYVGRADIFQAA